MAFIRVGNSFMNTELLCLAELCTTREDGLLSIQLSFTGIEGEREIVIDSIEDFDQIWQAFKTI